MAKKSSKFGRLSQLCNDLSDMKERMRSAAQNEFKPALKELAAVLAAEVPQVESVRWNQYIPGFNDGDVCEFTMGETTVRFTGDPEDSGDYENGFCTLGYNPEDVGNANQKWKGDLTLKVEAGELTDAQAVLLNELDEVISGLELASELAFGPNVEVTLNVKTGELEIEDYDCGH